MIVRILGEGQFDVAADRMQELNSLDAQLESAVSSGDEDSFRAALTALLDRVREVGSALPADTLSDSDLILPPADSTIDDVRGLLGDEGLIPG